MEEQQRLFEKEIQTLITVNDSEDARAIVIKRINKEFKDYLPNLLSEKSNLDDITKASDLAVLAMQKRIVAMQFEQEQREILDKRAAASAAIANQKILEAEGKLQSQRLENLEDFARPDELAGFKALEKENLKFNQNILDSTEGSIDELKAKYKIMAEELGFTFADLFAVGDDDDDEDVTGGRANEDKIIEDATAILQMEMAIANERQELLTQFAEGEIKTKADLNEKLKELELEHINFVLDANMVQGDALIDLERRRAQVRADIRKDEQKAEIDRIEQLKETGQLLLQIGEAEGENSRIRQIGIKVTQAAAIAEGIKGLMDGNSGILAQSKLLFPSNIIAMAATAAQVASVIANIKALLGGSGGDGSVSGDTSQSASVQFEKGGLTRGGMFHGASHANGGVKFRVGGTIHEAEGGEAIINKRSTARFRPILSAINSYNGNGVKFADGGIISQGEKFAMGGELRSVQSMVSGSTNQKVVLVESDVTETQNRISALESQSSF